VEFFFVFSDFFFQTVTLQFETEKMSDDDAPSSSKGKQKKPSSKAKITRDREPVDTELLVMTKEPDHAAHLDGAAAESAVNETVSFSEDAPLGKTFLKLEPQQTFLEGLFELDPTLVTNFKGRHGIFSRMTVLPGHIGLGSKYGQTKFFPPGNYLWTGVGGKWDGSVELQKGGEDVRVTHGEVTLLSLSENQVVVVQIDKNQYVIGSGRYIVRQPARLEGEPIDLQRLKTEHKATIITEGGEEVAEKEGKGDGRKQRVTFKDKQITKEITAGWTEQQGAICVIRPEPGFRYVIQTDRSFKIGDEFTIARGSAKFLQFLNFLQQSRTTRTFAFLSKDFQDVRVRVQLTWQLVDGVKWQRNGRAYVDPFDLLEEKAEAAFRDQIGGLNHLEALAQKSDGFADMEARVLPKLIASASRTSARKLDLAWRCASSASRSSRRREQALAEREVGAKEQIRERQIEIETKKLEDHQARQLGDGRAAAQAAGRRRPTPRRWRSTTCASWPRSTPRTSRSRPRSTARRSARLAKLEAKKKQEKIRRRDRDGQGRRRARPMRASSPPSPRPSAFLEVARAKNAAVLEEAEAQAQAAKKMAEALKTNEQVSSSSRRPSSPHRSRSRRRAPPQRSPPIHRHCSPQKWHAITVEHEWALHHKNTCRESQSQQEHERRIISKLCSVKILWNSGSGILCFSFIVFRIKNQVFILHEIHATTVEKQSGKFEKKKKTEKKRHNVELRRTARPCRREANNSTLIQI
jgi:hypothetical protein